MEWSDEQKRKIQKTTERYRKQAIEQFQVAEQYILQEQYPEALTAVQESLIALMSSALASFDQVPPSSPLQCFEKFQQEHAKQPGYSQSVEDTALQILEWKKKGQPDTGPGETEWDSNAIRRFERIWERYAEGFRTFQPYLQNQLATELATEADQQQFKNRQQRTGVKLMVVALVFCLLGGGLYWGYLSSPSSQRMASQAEFYWLSSQVPTFHDSRKAQFQVRVDGNVHQYQMNAPQPILMSQVRLVPANHALTEIILDRVELLGANEQPIQVFDFDSGSVPWTVENASAHGEIDGIWKLKPHNTSPTLTSPIFPEKPVNSIRLHFGLFQRLPFFHWLLQNGFIRVN